MVTLGGGFLALSLAASADDARARRHALLAGLLVGGTTLVRIDGLREAILLLVVVGAGGPATGGRDPCSSASVCRQGSAWSTTVARYLGDIAGFCCRCSLSESPSHWSCSAGCGGSVVAPACPPWSAARLPRAVGWPDRPGPIGLASRPLWMTARQDPNDPGRAMSPVCRPGRDCRSTGPAPHAEQSVDWLNWWLGPVGPGARRPGLVWLVHHATTRWVAAQDLPPWSWPLLVAPDRP